MPPWRRPTGTARFCDCSAPTTWPTLTPAVCIAVGLISTVISRSIAPTTSTSATSRMPRSSLVTPGSAICVSCAPVRLFEVSASVTIGKSFGIEALEDRLLDLQRQLVADLGDLVADLLHRLGRLLAELELGDDHAEAVQRLRVHLLEPADAGDALFDRVDQVALDLVGRRARERQRDRHHGRRDLGELVHLELVQREGPEDHERQHRDDGHDGALDGEIGDEHVNFSLRSTGNREPDAGDRDAHLAACARADGQQAPHL